MHNTIHTHHVQQLREGVEDYDVLYDEKMIDTACGICGSITPVFNPKTDQQS